MARNNFPNKSVKLKQILKFLSYRARSEKEIRDRLIKYGLTSQEIDIEVDRLKKWKLVDDDEFVRIYIESRSRSAPRSRKLLELELRHKGVNLEPSTYHLEPDIDLAHKALGKKNIKSREQAIRFLQSRGFSWETIVKALRDRYNDPNG